MKQSYHSVCTVNQFEKSCRSVDMWVTCGFCMEFSDLFTDSWFRTALADPLNPGEITPPHHA
jgi:hypothetical protein